MAVSRRGSKAIRHLVRDLDEMADKLAVFVPAERELDRLGQQVPAEGHDNFGLGVGAGSGRVFLGTLPKEGGGARDGEGGIFHN